MAAGGRRLAALATLGAMGLAAGAAWAGDPAPPVSLSLVATAETWRNTEGGLRTGDATLSKVAVLGTLDGSAIGLVGFTAHAQLFAVNGQALSGRFVGDLQTVSNIEAPTAVRLFELWGEQRLGGKASLRAGLMDLNADFDSIDPAQLFVDSSEGIGPDISKSGRNGPSIFPVSSLGVRGAWTPTRRLTLKAAVFDGVAGDPAHPAAFVAVKLGGGDGALVIGQADLALGRDAQVSLGVWGYTAQTRALEPGRAAERQKGVYAFVEGPAPLGRGWRGWLRAGVTDPEVEVVSSYLGAGLVKQAPLPIRPHDEAGVTVSRAGVGGPARRALGLPDAETTIEATYRLQAVQWLALQPDVQYVIHPASAPHLKNALVVGLRVIVTGDWPRKPDDP